MKPTALDELPVHQAPLPMARVASSDRNFYDRCYLNGHDRTGEVFFVAGIGQYPNLGVRDGFLSVRIGDVQHVVRASDALDERTTRQEVGPLRLEVVEPLHRLRLHCDHDDIAADLMWTGSFDAVLEQRHLLLSGNRPILDAQRFAQVGTWEGSLRVGTDERHVDAATWVGTRDRSWGIRPSGDADPAGRSADQPLDGFWWLYAPLRFDDFMVVVILQEEPDGHRSLNEASRVWADGRVEQLGWPRVEIDYRSGSRHPERARLRLTTQSGDPLLVEVETLGFVPLHIGCGYGGDPDWSHGQWRGRDWSSYSTFDLSDPDVAGRIPWGVSDHVARATCNGAEGYGLFEHASMGRHDPTGLADWSAVAG